MALGKRKPVQQPLFISTVDLNVRAHPFYDAVNKVLDAHHFDTTRSWRRPRTWRR